MSGILINLEHIIQNQGWLAFPLCFLGGIISSTSPCALAIVPLVVGFVGGYAEGSGGKAVRYTLVFTLGLTITFAVLGIIAGALGRLLGDARAFWRYVLPVVAILLGIHLLGILNFGIAVPERFLPKKKALIGALLLGLFFGLLLTPCATPVLAAILTFAATKKDIFYSGGLLLAYAAGHWMLVIAAGISTGFAEKIIQNRGISRITSYSKKAAGIVLIAAGVYFLIYLF
ncbi:MAG: cytochrome c biogenesis protein CcdA [Chloroflexota bacterium]